MSAAQPSKRRKPLILRMIIWILAWISGLLRFSISTAVIFAVMVAVCYMIALEYIHGAKIAGLDFRRTEVIAPDLRGKPLVEALGDLNEQNLSLKLERFEPSESMPAGTVVSQQPRAGMRIKADTPVRVVVSKGAALVPTPDLRGETKISAGIRLRKIGLNVGHITYLPAQDTAGGLIIATDPPGGSGAPEGARVNLLISAEREGQTRSMPRLDGLTLAEARELLGEMGLSLAETSPVASTGVLAGQIHTQSPNPGEPVDGSTGITVAYAPEEDYTLWQAPEPGDGGRRRFIPAIERLDGRDDEPGSYLNETPQLPGEDSPGDDGPSIGLDLDSRDAGPEDGEPRFLF